MKNIIFICFLTLSTSALADNWVNGYVRRDGTYVQPHMRSEPNNNRFDNYSSQGNTNPYTGREGYQRNEFSNNGFGQSYQQPRRSTYSNPYNDN